MVTVPVSAAGAVAPLVAGGWVAPPPVVGAVVAPPPLHAPTASTATRARPPTRDVRLIVTRWFLHMPRIGERRPFSGCNGASVGRGDQREIVRLLTPRCLAPRVRG